MMPEQPKQEGADFSNFGRTTSQSQETSPSAIISELPKKARLTNRVKIMIGILLLLIIVQALIYFLGNSPKPQPQLPTNNEQTK